MMVLTRRYRFSASHRLHTEALNEEENRELYGKCNHPYGHGHDYVLEVGVRGPLDREQGQMVDRAVLDDLVQRCVLDDFANRNLNQDVAEFREMTPTSENVVLVIRERLLRNWDAVFQRRGPELHQVRLQETARNLFGWQDLPAKTAQE